MSEIKKQIAAQFGEQPLQNPNYGKIISGKHFERLSGLLMPEKTVYGGGRDAVKCQIEPTVMDNVTWNDKVMQEEIFGPILPILTFKSFEDVFAVLKDKQKPLALYYFTSDNTTSIFIYVSFKINRWTSY